MIKKLSARYDHLAEEIPKIEATKYTDHGQLGSFEHIDHEKYSEWKVKAKSLIAKTCGNGSEHFKEFEKAEKSSVVSTNYSQFKRIRPVFLAAKSDFQGGYLTSIKNLVQAEIFDSELDQARELLSSGYKGPAAVVAGVVLETSLKDLCDQHSIPHSKLDTMNAELVKAGVYTKLHQKQVTALADIRNNAAHGNWTLFTIEDVTKMIQDVERFISIFLA